MRKAGRASRRQFLAASGAVIAASAVTVGHAAHADESNGQSPERSISEIRNGIYRCQNNRHYSVVIDTKDGLIVFDTINRTFAEWLNGQLAQRFSKPVRYVIYSHNHADHVSGGQAFAPHDPIYLSHALARDSMQRMQVDTRLPSHTFEKEFTIELGGRRIELRYHGPNDGRGSISLHLPQDRVLSVIDWLLIGRVPYRDLKRYNVDGMIRSLHEVDGMDWDIAIPGHADVGDKKGAAVVRRYLETIRDGVAEDLVARRTVEQTVRRLRPQLASVEEFASLKMFDDWVELNIRGVHDQIARVEGFADG